MLDASIDAEAEDFVPPFQKKNKKIGASKK